MANSISEFTVFGTPPQKLGVALGVIGDLLHQSLSNGQQLEVSKRSCVISSLTVRDFLQSIGFACKVHAVTAVMAMRERGWYVGLGNTVPGDGVWDGHMIVTVLDPDWLIDLTLYQAKYWQWPFLEGMVAAPMGGAELPRKVVASVLCATR